MDDIGDEMIHGTPSRPVIDGGTIDQDFGTPIPIWILVLMMALSLFAAIYMMWKFPHEYDGSGNLTRSIVTFR